MIHEGIYSSEHSCNMTISDKFKVVDFNGEIKYLCQKCFNKQCDDVITKLEMGWTEEKKIKNIIEE